MAALTEARVREMLAEHELRLLEIVARGPQAARDELAARRQRVEAARRRAFLDATPTERAALLSAMSDLERANLVRPLSPEQRIEITRSLDADNRRRFLAPLPARERAAVAFAINPPPEYVV